uniref:Uncharacterized protein n=1 Tax=Opuntia streptacantha TaxID=393608 RepID=A0A7C9AZL9_OPUST
MICNPFAVNCRRHLILVHEQSVKSPAEGEDNFSEVPRMNFVSIFKYVTALSILYSKTRSSSEVSGGHCFSCTRRDSRFSSFLSLSLIMGWRILDTLYCRLMRSLVHAALNIANRQHLLANIL